MENNSVEEKLMHEYEEQKEEEFIIIHDEDDDEEEEEEEEEDEFSFTSSFGELSLVSADDAFVNGELKPVFPLFNRGLLFDEEISLPKKPAAVRKIFVETKEAATPPPSSSSGDDDVISGPYCDLSSRRVVELTPSSSSDSSCKKSSSTGFSKIWRFKDHVSRTNSDGRDAYVFLNEPHGSGKKPVRVRSGVVAGRSTEGVKVNRRVGGGKRTTPYSAHEVYLRRKGREDKKRPSSYLPYRPELMGFFTSVNVGFSKNVHPY